ncbi:MAG: hypothetical protein OIF50_16200 [Flavobacteriaceae bacterium]|nr:hypothetical protein [Flavobacteriaceae bacterium]
MRKIVLYCLIWIGAWQASAQKFIYKSDKFDELSKNHKTLAILPFFANLKLESNKELDKKQLLALAEKEGHAVQEALETYFLKRKKKKKFTVTFQSVGKTNAILKRNGIDYNNLKIYTGAQLAEILKVDGIINGNLTLNALLSEGVSTSFSLVDYFLGKSKYGRIAIKISDGDSGKLIWKYEKEINRKSGRNTGELIDIMMRKASRRFPYEKERRRDKK